MISADYSFPHPVLGRGNDIEGEISVSFKVKRENSDVILYDIYFNIDNIFFAQLTKNGYASKCLKLYCSSTVSTWVFRNKTQIKIPEEKLINKVEVSAFIVTDKEILNYTDSTFHKDYDNTSFELDKHEIIALTGNDSFTVEKVDEQLQLGNIFYFHPIDDETEPTFFNFSDDQITIYTPRKDKILPYRLIGERMMWTAMNLYILPCLQEAFRLLSDPNEYKKLKNNKWVQVLEELLPPAERDDNHYINAQLALKSADPNDHLPIINSYQELRYK